jgi:YVTN family beta-propeller protein
MWVRALLCGAALSPAVFLVPTTTAEPPAEPKARPTYKSPLGVAVDEKGEKAYVALHTAGAVAVVDLKAGMVLQEIPVGSGPNDAAFLGKTLFVSCEADVTLVPVDLERHKVGKTIPLSRRPQVLCPDDDGRTLLIGADDSRWIGLRYEPETGEEHNVLAPPRVRSSQRGNAGGFSVTREPRNQLPATQTAQSWVFFNSIRHHQFPNEFGWNATETLLPVDEPQNSYGDLEQVRYSPAAERAFVVSAAANAVLVIDHRRVSHVLSPQRSLVERVGYRENAVRDLAISREYVIARIPTQANPRRLTLSGDGKTLVVSNYLSDSLTVIDTKALKVIRHIPLGGPEPDAVRRGEILFNSGKMTFHGQFTCASCHPNGGSDGLTWDLTRDGVGNFKKTKSLFGVKDTAPYGWEGSSPTLEDRIAGTLRTLHQHEPEGTEVADIAAYLRSLPPPRPLPVKDEDKPAVARGEKLFGDKAQCAKCHQGPTFQDGKAHDVGTRGETDTTNHFDTPSLRGVGRERIFLHDGRARTLEEVLTKYNEQKKHGAAHQLSKDELADLLEYLSSL